MRANTTPLESVSYSIQAPRLGIIWAEYRKAPVLSMAFEKYTPGERTSWDTITRSAPLMMKVPCSVISGKSPMNTSDSLISWVSRLVRRTVTLSGAAYVVSRSLHFSTVYFGLSSSE